MRQHILEIDAANDLTAVLEKARDFCRDHGVVRQSYHFSPIFDEPNSLRTVVHADGFDDDWLRLYDDWKFRGNDPIPARTYDHGSLLTWHDAATRWPNTPEQEAYFRAMLEHGLVHGFGLPLYGPRGRKAFASMDFDKPLETVNLATVSMVRIIAMAAHQRLCNLIDGARIHTDLSEREKQVLAWIAKGKSTRDIGTILDVAPETVKTYRERIYQKLGVNDHIGAVIRGLKLGLIAI